jgi:hypothetical protein
LRSRKVVSPMASESSSAIASRTDSLPALITSLDVALAHEYTSSCFYSD